MLIEQYEAIVEYHNTSSYTNVLYYILKNNFPKTEYQNACSPHKHI